MVVKFGIGFGYRNFLLVIFDWYYPHLYNYSSIWKNVNQQCKKSWSSVTKKHKIFLCVSRFLQNCYFSKWDDNFFKFFLRDFPKKFPCDECDKLSSSKRALNDHKRNKHNCQENVSAKIFKCGHCEVSFTNSCNLLHGLRRQHKSGSSFRCFFLSHVLWRV